MSRARSHGTAYLALFAPGVAAVIAGNALGHNADPHFYFLAGIVVGLEAAVVGGSLVALLALRVLMPKTFFRLRPSAPRDVPLPLWALLIVVAICGLGTFAIGAWIGGLSLADALLPLDSERVRVVRTEVVTGVRGGTSRILKTADGRRLEAPLFAAVFDTVAPGELTVSVGHLSRYVVGVAR